MGGCSYGRDYLTENEAENLFLDIISSYRKMNEVTKKEMIAIFYEKRTAKIEVAHDLNEEKETFSSIDYTKFLEHFADKSSALYPFHRNLPPKFDDLFDGYIQDETEYNLLVFALPYLNEKTKFKLVLEICEETTGDKMTVNHLLKFLKSYLHEQLIKTTERLVNIILQLKNNTLIKGTSYVINENMKQSAKECLSKYKDGLDKYYGVLERHILIFFEKNDKSRTEITMNGKSELPVKEKMVELLDKEYGFLFNVLDIRKDVWIKSKV